MKIKSIILVATLLTSSCLPPDYDAEGQAANLQDRISMDAQEHIASGLLDPKSAQFIEVNATKDCVRGKVNAKNAFGGYTGFQGFLYSPRSHRIVLEPRQIRQDAESDLAYLQPAVDWMKAGAACNKGAL